MFQNVAGRGLPRHGVVEVLAQQMEVHQRTDAGFFSRTILVPPRVLQNQQASTLMTGVNLGVPQFSIESLNAFPECDNMILAETPDNASA